MIVTYSGNKTTFSSFSGLDEYNTEDEANQACYAAGRDEIDKRLGPANNP